MKSLIIVLLMVPVLMLAATFTGGGRANARPAEVAIEAGTVRAVTVAPNARMARIETVEGRTYHVYGAPYGLEHSVARIKTAVNGVKYLCGGVPDNCSQLVD
jgi:hypothetical protein